MEFPKPPQDIELKNIIDKLAQFVARNGPDFEQMTKNKQKGNAKFDFLFGGEYFHYYRHKVNAEQACMNMELNGHASRSAPPPPPPPLPPSALGNAVHWLASSQNTVSVEMLTAQQVALNDQIRESETNLSAQHAVLLQQQQYAIDEAVSKAEESSLKSAATECGINFTEFDAVLQPIIDTCTKDAISAGKSWIIQRATASKTNTVISEYLLRKVIETSATFNRRLHIIYLLNDTFHHCMRKGADELKKALEKVLIPMFCTASLDVTDEQQQKLQKLLNLWENKNHYFSKEIINKLKNPTVSLTEYKSELLKKHTDVVEECTTNTKNTMEHYQSQHQAFVNHALQQIQNLEKQKQLIEQQKNTTQMGNTAPDDFCNVDTNSRPLLSGSTEVGQGPSAQIAPPPPPQQPDQQLDVPNDQRERTDGGVEEEVGLNNTSPNDDNRNNNANYDKESHHASSATYDSSNSRNNSEIINNDFSAPDSLEHQSSSSSSFNGNYWNSRDTADYNRHCEPLPPAKVVDYQHQDPSNLRLHNRTNCTTSRDYFHQSDSVNVQNASGDYYGGGPPATSAAAAANHQDSLMRAAPLPPFEADQPFTRRGQDQQSSQSLPFYRHDERPFASAPQPFNQDAIPPQVPFHQPPPGFAQPFISPDVPLPDLSRPPPLLNNIPPLMSLPPPDFGSEDYLVSKIPYYELPAGLMVPLVKLEDSEYKPLNPEDIKLPPPAPPTDRLLAAVKAFYSPPGHDRPRDSEGWEKLGLYEYYRAKGLAKQQKADDIAAGERAKSRTPSPVRRAKSRSRSPPHRKRYRSRSRSKSKSRAASKSPRPARSKRSPRRSTRERKRDRSRSPSCSTPPSSTVSDIQRSPTPPSFFGSTYGKSVEKLDESNKGHQLLRKMGWGGAGLGAKEQGIADPISGGEVRDRQDQYKGVGINLNDPYESFRKSKGQAFISRMKERAEERLGT